MSKYKTGYLKLRMALIGPKSRVRRTIVATPTLRARDRRYKEIVGYFEPAPNANGRIRVELKVDRVKYLIANGCRFSDPVEFVLGKVGLLPEKPARFQPIKDERRKQWHAREKQKREEEEKKREQQKKEKKQARD